MLWRPILLPVPAETQEAAAARQAYAAAVVEGGQVEVGEDLLDAGVPPENITVAESDFPGRFIDLAEGSYTYLGFPTTLAPFDNVDIRRALSLAIDRETIAVAEQILEKIIVVRPASQGGAGERRQSEKGEPLPGPGSGPRLPAGSWRSSRKSGSLWHRSP